MQNTSWRIVSTIQRSLIIIALVVIAALLFVIALQLDHSDKHLDHLEDFTTVPLESLK